MGHPSVVARSIAVGAAAALLASCSSSVTTEGTSASTSSSSISSSSEAASATSTGQTASVQQYASLVAQQKPDLLDYIDQLTGGDCDWTSPGSVSVDPSSVTCWVVPLTVSYSASTLSLKLKGAQKPGVPAYIGAVPDELKGIVEDTIAAADKLDPDKATAVQNCVKTAGPDCTTTLFDFQYNLRELKSQLAAWSPYGA